MSRKLWLGIGATLIVVLIAGLSVSGLAFARGNDLVAFNSTVLASNGISRYSVERSVSGTVVSVSRDRFTIRTRWGQELHFQFDAGTRFVDNQKQNLKLTDLAVGKWVTVYALRGERAREFTDFGRSQMQADRRMMRHTHTSRLVVRELFANRDGSAFATEVIIGAQKANPAPAAAKSTPAAPAAAPKTAPTATPMAAPTTAPKALPTTAPNAAPTTAPMAAPKASPTAAPKVAPTTAPQASPATGSKVAPTPTPTPSGSSYSTKP